VLLWAIASTPENLLFRDLIDRRADITYNLRKRYSSGEATQPTATSLAAVAYARGMDRDDSSNVQPGMGAAPFFGKDRLPDGHHVSESTHDHTKDSSSSISSSSTPSVDDHYSIPGQRTSYREPEIGDRRSPELKAMFLWSIWVRSSTVHAAQRETR